MQRFNILIRAILLASIAAVLASCSKNTTSDAKSADGRTVISVWAMGDEAKTINQLVVGFEKQYPNIQVKVQSIPWNLVHQKLLTALSGDSTPDVSMMGSSFMSEFVELEAFEDLTPYLAKESSTKLSDFVPNTLLTNQFDGKIYGLPWYADVRVMFYRKDLMQQAGFDLFPRTWDGLYKLAAAEKKNGVKDPIKLLKNDDNAPVDMLITLWQNKAEMINAQGKSQVNTPEFNQAITYYTSYFKADLAPRDLTGEIAPLFVTGKLGMFIGGPYMLAQVKSAGGAGFDSKWGVAMMPGNKTQTSFLGGSNFVMFKNAKHKDAAFKFIQYMVAPATEIKYYQLTANLPTVQAAWAGIGSNPTLEVFKAQLNDVAIPLNVAQGPRLYKALGDEVEQIIYNKETVEQGIKHLDRQVTQIMLR